MLKSLAASREWTVARLPSGRFDLLAFVPTTSPLDGRLTIYIEGDGLSWLSASTPSDDPTPRNPVALRLALAQPDGSAAYLGRPCQYVDARQSGCSQSYWTDARFSPEVVRSTNVAIDALKRRLGAKRLELIGYSGGGAVAMLVAAQRNDVARVVTIAGNLDHRAWTIHHRLEPLSGSLNAADVAERVSALPQIHYVGEKDTVIAPDLALRWPSAISGLQGANLRIIPGFDHACCWVEQWSKLYPGKF
ncbi:MAG: hypothetical protein QM744_12430 [Mesorhizobium sp.]